MIKLEHVVLPSPEQMEFVIEGTRNPLNSWSKSDSEFGYFYDHPDDYEPVPRSYIGPNDLSLMQKLSKAGTDHRKFMRMLPVMVRITAPLYWWSEFDTYKVGTVANSCSKMHKLLYKEFELSDFSTERMVSSLREGFEDGIIHSLNELRKMHIEYDEKYSDSNISKKDIWDSVLQLLPSSYNQTRNVMLNYEVLANIYHSRKGHKLDEWREFCKWIETLPYSELITGEDK